MSVDRGEFPFSVTLNTARPFFRAPLGVTSQSAHSKMKGSPTMAKHDVKFEIPSATLGNSDVVFEIRRNDKLLGKLEVSKGAIVWVRSHSKGAKFRLFWKDFDLLMEDKGEKVGV